MRCADGHYYVVKFQNDPQHTRVLVNDWLGTRLGEMIGLPFRCGHRGRPSLVGGAHARPAHRAWADSGRMLPRVCRRLALLESPLEVQVWDYLPETMIRGAKIGRLRRHPGAGQVELQRQWPPGGLLEAGAREREFHPPASSIRALVSTRGEWNFLDAPCAASLGAMNFTLCHIVGQLRTVAEPV